jgi:UDP-2-acetamido-3-amino-2,3-dideoxy-glucuronate N-acetyltransferase
MSQFLFPSGVRGHIYVSWLHPFKEQRLVVVGSEKMAVFDDTAEHKLMVYPHKVQWRNRVPTAVKAEGEVIAIEQGEPLRAECRHFLDCVRERKAPVTDGNEGLRVLKVLTACQKALAAEISPPAGPDGDTGGKPDYFVHPTARVDDGSTIGKGTKVWHYAHVMKGAQIGERCILGQNVNVDGNTVIGNNVKIQNNVSVYAGVTVEDDAFLGPSCVLTNVTNPRSQINRHALYEKTVIRRGATIGANATIVCGTEIGRYAFVAAGTVVTRDVPDYGLVMGNPGRLAGWMSRHGHRLGPPDGDGIMKCPESGYRYRETAPGVLRCMDRDEDEPLPADQAVGERSYDSFSSKSKSKESER